MNAPAGVRGRVPGRPFPGGLSLVARDGFVTQIHGFANPDKLAHVRSRLGRG